MVANPNGGNGSVDERWPALPFVDWRDTCDTLHMWTQVVGKLMIGLRPFLNEWWHVAFQVRARGLTTGPLPYGSGAFEADFDFVDHNLWIRTSSGDLKALPLIPRSVADFYHELMASLRSVGIEVNINTTPDEVEERIPFEEDHKHASYDRDAVERWWRIMLQTSRILDAFRSPFVGKSSPVHFFWGSFDLAHTRFSGLPCEPPPASNRLMQMSEDQENISCGFWPGDSRLPKPAFYSYTYPKPDGIETAPIRPEAAHWNDSLGEFVLLYDDVRASPAPEAALQDFFQSAYEAGANLRGWDRARLEREPSTPDRGSDT